MGIELSATAHKPAHITYHMIKNRVEDIDLGRDYYHVRARRIAIHNLKRQAMQLNFEVVPATT